MGAYEGGGAFSQVDGGSIDRYDKIYVRTYK